MLDAAEELLRETSLRELTIPRITDRAGMARSSFYVYFNDVADLIVRLGAKLQKDLSDATDRWVLGSGDIVADARAAIEGVVGVFREHGWVLRAMSDAASYDERVEKMYLGIVNGFIDVTEHHIRTEQEAGRIGVLDPRATASALIWMNERFLSMALGSGEQADVPVLVDTLLGIWVRALYRIEPFPPTN